MSTRRTKAQIAEAVARLREIVKPGDTVYTILRHRSASGMSRVISLYHFDVKDGKIDKSWLSRWVHNADVGNGWNDKYEGVKVGGCGMDMGFHLVYSLSRTLFPEGFGTPCVHCGFRFESKAESDAYWSGSSGCTYDPCPGNASRAHGAHTFRGRNGDTPGWDPDGGYALRQEWL